MIDSYCLILSIRCYLILLELFRLRGRAFISVEDWEGKSWKVDGIMGPRLGNQELRKLLPSSFLGIPKIIDILLRCDVKEGVL